MKSQRVDNALFGIAGLLVGVIAAAAFAVAAKLAASEEEELDATEELMRDPRNAARLMEAIESLNRGEWETHLLATRPPVAA